MFAVVTSLVLVCSALFAGMFRNYVPVRLTAERSGLVMESGAKVKLRGVEVGRVAGVDGGGGTSSLKLEIFPDRVQRIPANVEAEIKATTAFGAKYVDLVYPEHPVSQRLAAGAVLRSRNVSTEVNTVFDSLVQLIRHIDVPKLNAVLTALSEGVRGEGENIGRATSAANEVLLSLNPRMDTVKAAWGSFRGASEAYRVAAPDIMATLDAASATSATIVSHATNLDTLLLNAAGFGNSGVKLLAPAKQDFVDAVNLLEPTTGLLLKYSPSYTCSIQGARIFLERGGNDWFGGNGRTAVLDAGILMGDDIYRYPEHLPVVGAKGGPGGQPGCGSLPDVGKNFPVRQLITNTGWGTGLDWRPNPGIGRTCAVDYFPVTRGIPGSPHVGECLPGPAPGPNPPYPGGPPYGAPWYGADGTPLFPGVPPVPAPSGAAEIATETQLGIADPPEAQGE